jgi:leucyl-tRNA synthetase
MVLGEDSEKMSKSRGNVVAPDDLVNQYGADTVRAYLMFFARWDQGGPWSGSGMDGVNRWLRRVWSAMLEPADTHEDPVVARNLRRKLHQTLIQVTRDFEQFEFNTIVSSLMELMNEISKAKGQGAYGTPAWEETVDIYLRMLAPVAPHISEELWGQLGKPYSIHTQAWPKADESAVVVDEITLGVQVNGKLRDRITVAADARDEDVKAAALASEVVKKFLGGNAPRQVIYIKGRLVSIVV